jgi:nucleoside-diphosphate-sugar epimerase
MVNRGVSIARLARSQMTCAFVTGGSGFIGGRLIERLRANGYSVRALARSTIADGLAELRAV